jgi:hypothetical protein
LAYGRRLRRYRLDCLANLQFPVGDDKRLTWDAALVRNEMKTALLVGCAALLMATSAMGEEWGAEWQKMQNTRKWVDRCSVGRTPDEERSEAYEQCCKRWPKAPHCTDDYVKAMSVPRCAKLPHLANIRCAERILEAKKPWLKP